MCLSPVFNWLQTTTTGLREVTYNRICSFPTVFSRDFINEIPLGARRRRLRYRFLCLVSDEQFDTADGYVLWAPNPGIKILVSLNSISMKTFLIQMNELASTKRSRSLARGTANIALKLKCSAFIVGRTFCEYQIVGSDMRFRCIRYSVHRLLYFRVRSVLRGTCAARARRAADATRARFRRAARLPRAACCALLCAAAECRWNDRTITPLNFMQRMIMWRVIQN